MSNSVVAEFVLKFKDLASSKMLGVASKAKKMQASLSAVGKGIGVFGTALGASFGVLAKQQLELADNVQNFSRVANINVTDFQKLTAGAKRYGIESDKLSDIYKDVNDKVGDFMQTGGGPMKDFFEKVAPKVGVTADAFKDLSGSDALQLYYTSLEKANLSQADMTFYMEGIASDATMLQPLLKNNGEGFKKFGEEAQKAGVIMSELDIKNAQKMNDDIHSLKLQFTGMATTTMQALMPSFQMLADGLGKVAEFMRGLNESHPTLMKIVVGVTGLLVVIAPLLMMIGMVATGMSALAPIAGGLAVAIGAISLPMLAIVAVVGALVAVGAYWYANWDSLTQGMADIWNHLSMSISENWESLKTGAVDLVSGIVSAFATFLSFTPFGVLITAGNFLINNWGAIKATATSLVTAVVTRLTAMKTRSIAILTAIKTAFTTGFNIIKNVVMMAVNAIKAKFVSGLNAIKSIAISAMNAIKSAFVSGFARIKAVVIGAINAIRSSISNGLNSAVAIVRAKASAMISAFKGLGAKMAQAGRNIVQGLINGIRAKAGEAIAQARAMASKIASAVTGFFKIRSPSRLFTMFGEMLPAGLGKGIKDMAHIAVNQAKAMAKDVAGVKFGMGLDKSSMSHTITSNDISSPALARISSTQRLDVNVNFDGAVKGASGQANVTVTGDNNNYGGNMPFAI